VSQINVGVYQTFRRYANVLEELNCSPTNSVPYVTHTMMGDPDATSITFFLLCASKLFNFSSDRRDCS